MVYNKEAKFLVLYKHDFLTTIHKWESIGYQWKPGCALFVKKRKANHQIMYLSVLTS